MDRQKNGMREKQDTLKLIRHAEEGEVKDTEQKRKKEIDRRLTQNKTVAKSRQPDIL